MTKRVPELAVVFVQCEMDELLAGQFVDGIDPEILAPDAAPAVAADGAGNQAEVGIDANVEAQTPARAEKRSDELPLHASEACARLQRIGRHLFHGARLQDARPVELAPIQQHLT